MDYTSFVFSNPPQEVDAPVFVDADNPERSISWQQYATGVKRVAVGLQAKKVLEQECVALLSRNDIYISIIGDAVVAAGAIFACLPAEATQSELVDCCTAAQVKWLFAAPQMIGQARDVAKRCRIPDQNILAFDPPGLDHPSVNGDRPSGRFSQLLSDYDGDTYCNLNYAKDPARRIVSRLFTSGTTGTSKAVEVSHTATINRVQADFLGHEGRGLDYLHFIGMHHISGTIVRQQAVVGHHRMHVTNVQDPCKLLRLIGILKVQSVIFPPRTMIAITAAAREDAALWKDLQSVQFVTVGGSQTPNESMDDFMSMLSPTAALRVTYGCTELGMVSSSLWPQPGAGLLPGYVGTAYPDAIIKILEPESMRMCESNVDGEICAANDQIFNGYFGNQAATKSSFAVDNLGQRFFRTGDKGSLSSDGELHVNGRYKELFKVGTEDVAPAEVEALLMKHETVRDAAVTSKEDRHDSRYHEVQAFVVPNKHKTPAAQELVDFVAATLSPYKAPTGGVTMVQEIPRNAMRKVVARNLKTLDPLPGSNGYMNVSEHE